jgi:hypothetical protein
MNYNDILYNLNNGINFSLSRWGDGEFACILGDKGKNCDKHDYTPELREALLKAWESDKPITKAIQPHALKESSVVDFIGDYAVGDYTNADLLVKESMALNLQPFFDALSDKWVMLVAPKRFRDYKFPQILCIPETNCYTHYNLVKWAITQNIAKDVVILYCASMMSNVLIDDLYSPDITQIDCGSLFEPYVGHANRKYHKELIKKL